MFIYRGAVTELYSMYQFSTRRYDLSSGWTPNGPLPRAYSSSTLLVRTCEYRPWEDSSDRVLIPRTESVRFSLEDAALDSVKREIPVKLSRKPHIIEMILVQLLVFSPW